MTPPARPLDPATSPDALHTVEIDREGPRRLLDLSVTQLLGGSLAAATAAGLGSRLGVVGTITGAAVGSVVTAVAASVYTTSMTRARDALLTARFRTPGTGREWRRLTQRAVARRVLTTAAVVFLVAAAFLSGLQLATGASVTGTSVGTRQAQAGGDPISPQAGSDGGQVATTPTSTPSATTAVGGGSSRTGTPTAGPASQTPGGPSTVSPAPSVTPSPSDPVGTQPAPTGSSPTPSSTGTAATG